MLLHKGYGAYSSTRRIIVLHTLIACVMQEHIVTSIHTHAHTCTHIILLKHIRAHAHKHVPAHAHASTLARGQTYSRDMLEFWGLHFNACKGLDAYVLGTNTTRAKPRLGLDVYLGSSRTNMLVPKGCSFDSPRKRTESATARPSSNILIWM